MLRMLRAASCDGMGAMGAPVLLFVFVVNSTVRTFFLVNSRMTRRVRGEGDCAVCAVG